MLLNYCKTQRISYTSDTYIVITVQISVCCVVCQKRGVQMPLNW